MAHCPNCQHEIADDFGLVTCANCGAQVLLSMDGSTEVAKAGTTPGAGEVVANLEQNLIQEVQEAVEPVASSTGGLETHAAAPIDIEPAERGLPATPDMSEVAAFGNSSASTAREGGLRFNIFLSGIDSVEIRKQVQEALTDERFLWDAEALVSKARSGELKITNVSAVKSSLVIQRLRSVSVDIRWEQYAIHQ